METNALQNKAERKNLDVKQSYESAVLEKELAEEGSYVILMDVSEEDIPAIQVGDSVAIVMNAYEGEKWTETVSAINTSVSENYAATVSYPVTAQIEGDTTRLYGGMSADVTFVTKEADEVLYVS